MAGRRNVASVLYSTSRGRGATAAVGKCEKYVKVASALGAASLCAWCVFFWWFVVLFLRVPLTFSLTFYVRGKM